MYAYIDAFEKAHPEVSVVVNDFDHEEYKVAIRNFLQADAPDIAIWFAGNRMKFFVDQGLLEDVSDVWESAGFNDSMAASKGSLTVDGKQYGVPYAYYQWGVYYRKDIFDELGLNEPREILKNLNGYVLCLRKMVTHQLQLEQNIFGQQLLGLIT